MSLTDYGFYILCATAVVLLATQAVVNPVDFIQVTIFGLTQGAIYALVALGYTMVYGMIALLITFPVVMLVMGGINVAIERVAYRPLRNAPRLAPLITAIGMSFFLEGVMFFWKGPATVHFPDILPPSSTTIGGVFFGFKDVFVVVSAELLVVLLAEIINRTELDKAMRANVQDRDAEQLMGIDLNRTIAA